MKYRSNSILAFIPQNKEGEIILNQSLFFQQKLQMRIFVMDIIKSSSVLQSFQTKKILHCQREEVEKLQDFVQNAIQKKIPNEVILRIRWGKIIPTLIKESIKGGYEFAIIDKSEGHYKGSLDKNKTDKFVSKSHCPVLTVNKDFPIKKVNKIIIPIDISQTTKKRLYWATFFAKQLKAKIQIVSALNIDIEETKSLAFKNAERLKVMLLDRGIDCDIKILKVHKKQKHKAILEYIEKEEPEMVIIRTHQEFRFSGKKIGKFVSEIIHKCKMPVFTVGGKTHDFQKDFNN